MLAITQNSYHSKAIAIFNLSCARIRLQAYANYAEQHLPSFNYPWEGDHFLAITSTKRKTYRLNPVEEQAAVNYLAPSLVHGTMSQSHFWQATQVTHQEESAPQALEQ